MPSKCPRCGELVYFNEFKMANNMQWHDTCYTCAIESCKRQLDPSNMRTHENEIYCKHCYYKLVVTGFRSGVPEI
ncbi:cysteine and glycine-rich protein 3-like [Tachypleus tridentatus]|uniref:cysteine and glycine-rich protein 3-like n=1 Tax=Tachypleus tridentatus TaxID=6853 RepID=UPI003FD55758